MTSSRQPLPGGGASAPLRWQDIKPDVDNATPLYLQMSRKLAAAIRNGTWRPGDALPSERRLSEALNVSRITSRKALALLVQQGLIRRVHGAGTFIAIPFDDESWRHSPVCDARRLREGDDVSHWLSRAIRVASADEVTQLGLSPGDEVADMQWLHYDDGGIATALEIAIVPAVFTHNPYSVGDVSLNAFRAQYVAPVERQSQRYAAIHAPQQIAAHLRIEPGSAVLRITRISYGHAQRALELTHLYCRSDDCEPVAGWRKPSATTET
jgi:GntR family transcriptional regulator